MIAQNWGLMSRGKDGRSQGCFFIVGVRDSFIWETWLLHMRGMPSSYQGHLHMRDMTHTSHVACSGLQHTATHYNPRQHTATHCNTLQHTATHCNTRHITRPSSPFTESIHSTFNFRESIYPTYRSPSTPPSKSPMYFFRSLFTLPFGVHLGFLFGSYLRNN